MPLAKELVYKKILLVDDVASMRNMAKSILWDAGFKNIKDTDNASTAFESIKRNKVDLVICDWEMPGMNGLDLLKKVRNEESTSSTSFLMLTASSNIEHVKEAIAEGVTDYITKPFQADALCSKVISAIS